ncbi:MAG: hypothetical protein ABJE79_08675 [Marinomonas sp.]
MVIVNVDFFSSGKVAGWTNAKTNHSKKVIIRSDAGDEKDITDFINIYRADVAEKFGYSNSELTGFNINLFDLFNTRVKNFSIIVDDFEAWSSHCELYKLEHESRIQTKRFVEIGGKRLFVLYEQGSWLDNVVGRLNAWGYSQFNKSMNNGISISFMNVTEFEKNIKNTDLSGSKNIFLMERAAVRDCIILDNDISLSPIIILEKNIDLSLDFSGLLNTVAFMNNYQKGTEVTAVVLREVMDSLITYSELFFEDDIGSLLYVSGNLSGKEEKIIRALNKGDEPFNGCVLISEETIKKLSDFNKTKHSVFINSSLLRQVFDIVDADPIVFLEACLKRGIKVKNIKEENTL